MWSAQGLSLSRSSVNASYCLLPTFIAHRRVDFEMLGGKIIISQWTDIVNSEMIKGKWEALKATWWLCSHTLLRKSHIEMSCHSPGPPVRWHFVRTCVQGGDLGKCPSKVRKKSNVNPPIRRMSELNLIMSAGIKRC